MRRWKLAVVFVLVMVVVSSSIALAKNYKSPPSPDQIKPGDTLDYGDAVVNVVRIEGIASERDVTVLDLLCGGLTDIWFVYVDPLEAVNGPEGYGYTETDRTVDMLKAVTRLYDQPVGHTDWHKKDEATAVRYDDIHSGDAWVDYFHYWYTAPATIGFMGMTTHTVRDSTLSQDVVWYSDDSF